MLSPTLLLAAAISLMPIKTFDAWDIGCDNGGRCQALAIPDQDDSIGFANASDGGAGVEGLGVLITRDAGPDGAISTTTNPCGFRAKSDRLFGNDPNDREARTRLL